MLEARLFLEIEHCSDQFVCLSLSCLEVICTQFQSLFRERQQLLYQAWRTQLDCCSFRKKKNSISCRGSLLFCTLSYLFPVELSSWRYSLTSSDQILKLHQSWISITSPLGQSLEHKNPARYREQVIFRRLTLSSNILSLVWEEGEWQANTVSYSRIYLEMRSRDQSLQ